MTNDLTPDLDQLEALADAALNDKFLIAANLAVVELQDALDPPTVKALIRMARRAEKMMAERDAQTRRANILAAEIAYMKAGEQ